MAEPVESAVAPVRPPAGLTELVEGLMRPVEGLAEPGETSAVPA